MLMEGKGKFYQLQLDEPMVHELSRVLFFSGRKDMLLALLMSTIEPDRKQAELIIQKMIEEYQMAADEIVRTKTTPVDESINQTTE